MRLKFSSSPRAILVAVGLTGLITLLWPLWAAQLVISRLRTAPRTPTPVDIPRIDIVKTDLRAVMRHRTPVIISGLTASLDLDLLPDLDVFRNPAEDELQPFRVKTHSDHSPYFLFRGDDGAELDHTSDMDLDEFLRVMFDAEQAPGTCTYRLFSVADLDGRVGGIVDNISNRLAERTDATPDRQASGLWIGSRRVVTPLHHDAWTGLVFQFHRTKRIRMFSPADRTNPYFSSQREPTAVWSHLPGRSADTGLSEFPRFARETPYEGELAPGEVLFIPPYWSHEIEALEANISMPIRFTTTMREHIGPGFLVRAMEVFDSKFVQPRAPQW